MKKSIQVDIEVLQSEIFTLSQYLKDKEMEQLHGNRFRKMIKALTSAISWGEAMRDAGDMLPEIEVDNLLRKLCSTRHTLSLIPEIRDRIRDLCQPIVSKLLLRIKELRELNQ